MPTVINANTLRGELKEILERVRKGERFTVLYHSDPVCQITVTLIRIRLGLEAARRWWDQVEASSRLRWEWIDPVRAERARRWFFSWVDKRFSYTDCTSFVVMRELHWRRALTTDKHFLQAGFEPVP